MDRKTALAIRRELHGSVVCVGVSNRLPDKFAVLVGAATVALTLQASADKQRDIGARGLNVDFVHVCFSFRLAVAYGHGCGSA